jgi:hypothetical protein
VRTLSNPLFLLLTPVRPPGRSSSPFSLPIRPQAQPEFFLHLRLSQNPSISHPHFSAVLLPPSPSSFFLPPTLPLHARRHLLCASSPSRIAEDTSPASSPSPPTSREHRKFGLRGRSQLSRWRVYERQTLPSPPPTQASPDRLERSSGIELLHRCICWIYLRLLRFVLLRPPFPLIQLTQILLQSSPTPNVLASLPLSPSSPTPTSLLFLTPSHLLVGLSSGVVLLLEYVARDGLSGGRLNQLGELAGVHGDGVSDLAILSKPGQEQDWSLEVETAGKDGTRCIVEVVIRQSAASIRKVDECVITGRGSVEKVRPFSFLSRLIPIADLPSSRRSSLRRKRTVGSRPTSLSSAGKLF